MYADFKYHSPGEVGQLFDLLTSTEAPLVYAGGTDLLVWLRGKTVSGQHVIDVKNLPELGGIKEEADYISIGAAVNFYDIITNELITKWAPALRDASAQVGSVQIRHKGTLGGNIQTASPAGDGLVAAMGLDAEVEILSPTGQRRLPLAEFVLGPRQTALLPNEIISRICIPKYHRTFQRFFKVGRRNALAISVVNGVVALCTDRSGKIESAGIVLGAVAPTPVRVSNAEDILTSSTTGTYCFDELMAAVRGQIKPISDLRASADYRSYIAGIMVKREIQDFLKGERT